MKKAPPGILPLVGVDRRSRTPLHRQLYEGYRDAIVERRLRAGERLSSTRALAAEFRISRIPVVSACEQLLAEGYIESRVGSGTCVSAAVQEEPSFRTPAAPRTSLPPGPRRVSRASERLEPQPQSWTGGRGAFRLCEPALDHFPVQRGSALVARHSRASSPGLLGYGDPMGLSVLREALTDYLRTSRGVRCEAGQILVVRGSQQALELSSRVLIDPGDPVWLVDRFARVRDTLDVFPPTLPRRCWPTSSTRATSAAICGGCKWGTTSSRRLGERAPPRGMVARCGGVQEEMPEPLLQVQGTDAPKGPGIPGGRQAVP